MCASTSTVAVGLPPGAYALALMITSVVGLGSSRSVSKRMLDSPGLPKYTGSASTGICSSASGRPPASLNS